MKLTELRSIALSLLNNVQRRYGLKETTNEGLLNLEGGEVSCVSRSYICFPCKTSTLIKSAKGL